LLRAIRPSAGGHGEEENYEGDYSRAQATQAFSSSIRFGSSKHAGPYAKLNEVLRVDEFSKSATAVEWKSSG
jgi:hypothetical protein